MDFDELWPEDFVCGLGHTEDWFGIPYDGSYGEIVVHPAFEAGGMFWRGEGRYCLADNLVVLP